MSAFELLGQDLLGAGLNLAIGRDGLDPGFDAGLLEVDRLDRSTVRGMHSNCALLANGAGW